MAEVMSEICFPCSLGIVDALETFYHTTNSKIVPGLWSVFLGAVGEELNSPNRLFFCRCHVVLLGERVASHAPDTIRPPASINNYFQY